MNIGIDLGTTYSVIAVYGDVKTKGNYPASQYLNECDVTLIPSPNGEFAIPSAFWCDPNDPKKVIIGSEAKELANQGETPILFSKRSIGTNRFLKIGDKEFSAKQVATEILKYLKQCAETALGITIRRAVITHPAYFSLNQIEETRQAAIDAGFDMSNGEQMLMEPVAAAMAYIASDPRDNIKILTYDLGGGTFDVTVLERKDGIPTKKAFEGNPLLGGYNFDRRFISWLLDRVRDCLKNTGRTFVLNENDSSSQSCWSRLLQLAERIKFDLVLKPTSKVTVPIKADNILYDSAGKPIQIVDKINREEYTALIQDLLDDTIEKSMNALKKAEVSSEDINVIVLVGGSSYGQWVQETVKKAFPKNEVSLYGSPDLCVAAGAAIFAHYELPPVTENPDSEFEILVDAPRISVNSPIAVIGTIKMKGGNLPDADLRKSLKLILVTPENVEFGPVDLNDNGVFMFQNVELLEGEPTNLKLKLLDSEARERAVQSLSIEYNPKGPNEGRGLDIFTPMRAVPKSIFIRTASGLVTIAKEADKLPVKSREIELVRLYDDSTIDLDVYQGGDKVTTIKIEGIPEDAGKGSLVSLTLKIEQNVMSGTVKVKRLDGSLATEWPVKIEFPPIRIPNISELQDTFNRLDAKRQEEIHHERDPLRRGRLAGIGERIVNKIKKLFAERFSETQEIYQAIKELEALLTPAEKDEMQPPVEKFIELANECRTIISENESEQNSQHLRNLERIEKDGNDAQLMKDKRKWSAAFDQLKSLHSRLRPPPPPKKGDEDGELPPTYQLKDLFHQDVVEDLQSKLNAKIQIMQSKNDFNPLKHGHRVGKIEMAIKELQNDICAVDDQLEPEKAIQKLQPIRNRKKPKVSEMIRILDLGDLDPKQKQLW